MITMRARYGASALAVGAILAGAGPAGAQTHRGFGVDANTFKPTLDGNGLFTVERAQGLTKHDFTLRLSSHFSQEPLALDSVANNVNMFDGSKEPVLDYQVAVDFGFAFGLSDKLTFGFEIPIILQPLGSGYGTAGRYFYNPASPEAVPRPGTGFYSSREEQNVVPSENGPGDLRVGLKYLLFTGKRALALQAVVYVPFGDEDVFAGSNGFTFEPRVIYELPIGKKGRLSLNLGARVREGELAQTRQVDQNGNLVFDPMTGADIEIGRLYVGSEGLAAAGFTWALLPSLVAGVEANLLVPITTTSGAECPDEKGCKNGDLTGDVMGGFMFGIGADKRLAVGAGTAILPDAARSPGFRVAASFVWTPSLEGSRSTSRGDRDSDGLPDGPDVCPDEPEDGDGFQDDDGCPELDNDLDGVLDAQDKCASEPEDRDGYDDDDGCPEGDNDKDNVPDLTDRCPREAEDRDGFDDEDGCPDEDNDGDGILDAKDQCANEPETVNGYQDLDGCPDQGVQGGPKLTNSAIDLQGDRIEFAGKSANLTKASEGLLDQVAGEMKKAPNVRFRIEVSVDQSGTKPKDKAADQRLTEQRAQVVRDYLVKKGIDARLLDPAGLGSTRPIDADPKSAKNRRVDFIRLNQ
jgi:outer membrane protein OmpA-like peptidoglycan-associated protein